MTTALPASGQRQPRVLLVGDDALVLRSLGRILRRAFDVVTATDAADAIAKMDAKLRAVITDHDLGAGPDGRTVLAPARVRVPSASGSSCRFGPRALALAKKTCGMRS